MPCPSTCSNMFCVCPNFLGQTKTWIALVQLKNIYTFFDCTKCSRLAQNASPQKEIPGYWQRNPYDYGLDPTLMPTRPKRAPMTPPSPIDQTPETIWDIQQTEQIVKELKRLRKAAAPTQSCHPCHAMGHENTNKDPQIDDHDEEVQGIIDPTPSPGLAQKIWINPKHFGTYRRTRQ